MRANCSCRVRQKSAIKIAPGSDLIGVSHSNLICIIWRHFLKTFVYKTFPKFAGFLIYDLMSGPTDTDTVRATGSAAFRVKEEYETVGTTADKPASGET